MSTRGWVTVNVFWLVNKEPKDDYLGPHIGRDQLELCPLASGILSKHERDVLPASVHVSYTQRYFIQLFFFNACIFAILTKMLQRFYY